MDINIDHYKDLSRPPRDALTQIGGGSLKGFSNINPQWRLEAMHYAYGPIGIGWSITDPKFWTEPGANGEVLAFCLLYVSVKTGEGWSVPSPGIGGSTLIDKTASGLKSNDEGYKMAYTDAISVALKPFGVGADIYKGNWDGSKYKHEDAPPPPPQISKEDVIKQIKSAGLDELTKIAVSIRGKFNDRPAEKDAVLKAYQARKIELEVQNEALRDS